MIMTISNQYNLIKETISGKKSEDYHLILSAHGLPKSIILSGDPYEIEVNSNVSALKIFLKERDLNLCKDFSCLSIKIVIQDG